MASEASLEMLEDWEEWDPNSGTSFMVHALAGSCAGAAEHCVMFPFDTIKTYMQAETGSKASIEAVLQNIVKNEGFYRLWRGVSTMLTGCIPAHAAYFSIYEHSKVMFGVDQPGHHPIAAAVTGMISTVAHDSIMTPMDVIKQRMQLGLHSSIADCFQSILRTEGASALMLSFPTTLFMNIPYAGIMVATNESLKTILNPTNEYNVGAFIASGAVAGAVAAAVTNPLDVAKTRLQTQNILSDGLSHHKLGSGSKPANRLHFRNIGALGGDSYLGFSNIRGMAAYSKNCRWKYTGCIRSSLRKGTTTVTQSQIREVYSSPHTARKYSGLFDAMGRIYAEEGLAGFARGLKPRLVVHAPSVAISWTAYESAKALLNQAEIF